MISKRVHLIVFTIIVSIIGACSSTEEKKAVETSIDTVFIETEEDKIARTEVLRLAEQIKVYEDSLSIMQAKLSNPASDKPKVIFKTIHKTDSASIIELQMKLDETRNSLREAEELIKQSELANNKSNAQISLFQNEINSLQEELEMLEDSLVAVQSELTIAKSKSPEVIYKTSTKEDSATLLKLQKELNQTKNSLKEAQELVKITEIANRKSTNFLQFKVDSLTRVLSFLNTQRFDTTRNPEISMLEIELAKTKNELIKSSKRLNAKIDSLKYQSDSLSLSLTNLIASNSNQETAPAEKNNTSSENLSEAFRIYLEAKSVERNDPTLAAKLMRYASSLSKDSIITNYYQSLPKQNIFYENVIENVAPIIQMSIGSDRLINIFSSGVAHYYVFEDGNVINEISSFDGISSAEISERNSMILGRKNGTIAIFNINREAITKNLTLSDGPISSVGYIGNALFFLAVGTSEKTVLVLDKRYKEVSTLVGMKFPVSTISVNQSTGYMATACGDMNPRIWSPKGKLLLKLEDQSDSVRSVAISPSSKYLLTTNADGKTKIWTSEGMLKVKGPTHQAAVSASLFLTDQLYATGDQSGIIFIWDNNGDVIHRLSGHRKEITSLIFKNGNTLYSSSLDGSIKKWELKLPQDTGLLPPLSDVEQKRFKIN